MNLTCNNCEEVMSRYLCDMPYEWATQVSKVICDVINLDYNLDCPQIVDCQTVTKLSTFSQVGNDISITYTDEKGNKFKRTFNALSILNDKLNLVDQKCITTSAKWLAATYEEKLQYLINYRCDCCTAISNITTTTTSTTTTTTQPITSTTSTTTVYRPVTSSTTTTSTAVGTSSTTTTTTGCPYISDVTIVQWPPTSTTTTTLPITSTTTTTFPPTTTSTTTEAPTTTSTTTVAPTSTTTTTTTSIQLIAKKIGGNSAILKYGINDSTCPITAGAINTVDTIFSISNPLNGDIIYVEVYINGNPLEIVPACVQLSTYCTTYICSADLVHDGVSNIYVQTDVDGIPC